MSVYVGIDVHRKRSQLAVVDEAGEVLVNRNVPNGVEPILEVIGDLPVHTPVAFEAAFGWGWLVVDGIHRKVRLKQDKVCLLVMIGSAPTAGRSWWPWPTGSRRAASRGPICCARAIGAGCPHPCSPSVTGRWGSGRRSGTCPGHR
jgi:hypothetical protein